jgi:vancomycin resistance protein VanJ
VIRGGRREKGRVRVLARAAWLFGAAVLSGLVVRHLAGDAIFLGRYTGYVMPWLLAGLLPAGVWALRTRRLALAAVLGASVASIVALHVPRFAPREPPAPAAGPALTVLSFNTWSKNADAERIAQVILGARPDVVLLQEIPPRVFERLVEVLRAHDAGRPVHVAYEPRIQQGVVSHHPVEPRACLEEKGNAQQVVLRSPAGPVTVFNVHPLRSGGWRHRYGEIAALLEEDVLRERGPVILGGDLNANEHTALYRLLSERLQNAHERAGSGFGFTWPAMGPRPFGLSVPPPMVRIDHLFFSAHFVALRAETLEDAGGSDHRPVLAVLRLVAGGDGVPADPLPTAATHAARAAPDHHRAKATLCRSE